MHPSFSHLWLLRHACADTQVFKEEDAIDDINDAYWQLRAEAVPQDQLDMPEQDQLLYVYHCTADQQSQVRSQLSFI